MADQLRNLYELLEGYLSVEETSIDAVKKAISEKLIKIQNQRSPKAKAAAELIKKELNELQKRLEENPNRILQEQAAYKEIAKQKQLEKEKTIREKGTFLVQNGIITEANLKVLVAETNMSEMEILQMLGAKLKRRKIFSYTDDDIKELDEITYKGIIEHLNNLGHKTIYEWLQLNPNASLQLIQQQIDAKRHKVTEGALKSHKDPVFYDNTKALVERCTPIFKDEKQRKSYDKALENSGFIEVRKMIQMLRANASITPGQYKRLLEIAIKNGIARNKAEYLIYTTAEKENLRIDDGATDLMIVCRYCGTLNEDKSAVCRECGMPVKVICPACGKEAAPDDLTCTHCGFSLIDMKNAPVYLKMAQVALESNNIEDAVANYNNAQSVWPTYQQLVQLKNQINQKKVSVVGLQKEIETLCKQKKYYTAQKNISALASSSPLRREIESALSAAETFLRKADEETNPNCRLDLYIQALNAAADCSAANDRMRATPLAAPTALQAVAEGNHIRLSWQKTESNYITYLVVRKEKSQPANSRDGERIGETMNSTYDDLKAVAGVSYFYAVFSKYGEFVSSSATVTSAPVMQVESLRANQVKVNPTERSLEFTFDVPKGISAIDIYRDKTLVKTLSGNSFVDSGLVCEQNYQYRFVAVYKDSVGNIHKAEALEMTFAPVPKLEAVSLRVEESERQAVISWETVKKGSLFIYYADQPFPYHANDILTLDAFRAERLNVSGTSVTINKDFSGERYYMPVTILGSVGVVGKGVSVVSIARLQNTLVKHEDNNVIVRWHWGNASMVRLHYRIDRRVDKILNFLQSKDKDQYAIPLPAEALSVEVSLCSVVMSNGKELLGTPVTEVISLQAMRVEFLSVENKKMLFVGTNDYVLSLRAQASLPCDLHVIAKEQLPPIDLVNYTPVAVLRRSDVRAGEVIKLKVHFERRKKGEKLYFRLVAANAADRKKVIISPETMSIL